MSVKSAEALEDDGDFKMLLSFTLNYIFGAGVLAIPYAFVHGGILVSSFVLIFSSFLSLISSLWLFEVQARAQNREARIILLRYKDLFNNEKKGNENEGQDVTFARETQRSFNLGDNATGSTGNEVENLMTNATNVTSPRGGSVKGNALAVKSSSLSTVTGKTMPQLPIKIFSPQQMEIVELCEYYLGKNARNVYNVAITVFVISSAWIYASIFALSAQQIKVFVSSNDTCDISSLSGPIVSSVSNIRCYYDYLFYLAVFAVLELFLISLGLGRLKTVQQNFTGIGFFALLLIIIWTFVLLVTFGPADLSIKTEVFDHTGFGNVFNTFVFAQVCHMGVPTMSRLDKSTGKITLYKAIASSICITTVSYLVLGIVCSLTFGNDVKKVITLNWHDAFFVEKHVTSKHVKRFLTVLSHFIGLYPCITCAAAFPLYVITLGNNWLENAQSSKDHGRHESIETPLLEQRTPGSGVMAASDDEPKQLYISNNLESDSNFESFASRKTPAVLDDANKAKIYHLLSALVPIALAAVLADVRIILVFIGYAAFVISFFVPGFLQLKSKQLSEEEWGKGVYSIYDSLFSRNEFVYLCLAFAVFAVLFSTAILFRT